MSWKKWKSLFLLYVRARLNNIRACPNWHGGCLTAPGQRHLPWKRQVIWEGAPMPVQRRKGKKKAIFLLFWASRIAITALCTRGPVPFPWMRLPRHQGCITLMSHTSLATARRSFVTSPAVTLTSKPAVSRDKFSVKGTKNWICTGFLCGSPISWQHRRTEKKLLIRD